MKKLLRFIHGPMAGQDVEVDEDEATIQSLLDTGFANEAEAPPEPVPVVRKVREPIAEPAKEEEKVVAKKRAPPKKKRVRRKRETPEG